MLTCSIDIREAENTVIDEFHAAHASIGVSSMLTERHDSTARPADEA
jgi:hypothetical protein